jgi:hypothetical protein
VERNYRALEDAKRKGKKGQDRKRISQGELVRGWRGRRRTEVVGIGRISPVSEEEEEDTVIAVVDAGSIASSGMFLAAGRSSWERLLGSMWTMAMGRRGDGGGSRKG